MIYLELMVVILLGTVLELCSIKPLTPSKKRKLYMIICIAIFLVMAALRSVDWAVSMGVDAGSYKWFFGKYHSISASEIIRIFVNRQEIYMGESDIGEIGFVLLNRVIGFFTDNYNIYCLFADLLFFVPFGLLLYKYTTNIRQMMFAFVFYIALIQIYMISGARQMFAVGMVIMAFLCMAEGRYKECAVFYLLGISMHLSSGIFVIPLLLIVINIKTEYLKRIHLMCLLISIGAYLFPNQLIKLMVNVSGLTKYARFANGDVQGGANTFIILMELLSLFCYLTITKTCLSTDCRIKNIYTVLPILSLFVPLIRSNGSMIRISLYFFVFMVVLVPYGIERIVSANSKRLAYAVVLSSLAFLIIRSGITDYHFMWQ